MNRFVIAILRAGCAQGLAVALGCVDTTPLLEALPGARYVEDAGMDGIESNVAEASAALACRSCVVGDGGACRPQYDDCAKDAKCKAFIDCALDLGCLAILTFQDRLACVDPCLKLAEIATSTDPALQIAVELNLCTLDSCGTLCGGGD